MAWRAHFGIGRLARTGVDERGLSSGQPVRRASREADGDPCRARTPRNRDGETETKDKKQTAVKPLGGRGATMCGEAS